MPNWCEGSFKIRGKFEDLKRFCKEELKEHIIIADTEDFFEMKLKKAAYISGTRRDFITSKEIYFSNIDNEDKVVVAMDFIAVSEIYPEPYLELAKKYNIDIRLYGFEKGLQFNQEVIIEDNKIKKNETIKFDNYEWDCIFPNLGG